MKIATLPLDNPVLLAPMAGISNLPYRRLMKRFGAALVCTEMVSASGLHHNGRATRALLASCAEERPLAIQLFGSEPALMAAAAQTVTPAGDLIDINLGCPVRKVVRSGAGSALLRDPRRVAAIVTAVRSATPLPLTVKLRSGWDAHSINFLEVARAAVDHGADALTLHPRTRAQGFGGRSDWEHLARLKQAVRVPVIGSGDIVTADDALRMLAQTGCDGIMIGRGAFGNPWLIREILTRLSGADAPPPPTVQERYRVVREHLALFLEHAPDLAARELRKHLGWYVRGLPGAAAFRADLNRVLDCDALSRQVDAFFAAQLAESA